MIIAIAHASPLEWLLGRWQCTTLVQESRARGGRRMGFGPAAFSPSGWGMGESLLVIADPTWLTMRSLTLLSSCTTQEYHLTPYYC